VKAESPATQGRMPELRRGRPAPHRAPGWARAALVLLFLSVPTGVLADAGAAGPGLVNMEFRDTDLPTVLRAICRGAGLDFVLEPDVKGNVTAKLRNTSWDNALDIILKSHSLTAKRQGSTLLISTARPAAASAAAAAQRRVRVTARPDGKLDFDAAGADLREAVRELATVAKLNIVTSKDIAGTVTAGLRGLQAEEILLALADSCGAALQDKGHVIHLIPRPIGAATVRPTALEQKPTAPVGPAGVRRLPDGRLAIHVEKVGLRDVLRQVSVAADLNIVAAPELNGSPVSLDLNAVTPQDALAAIAAHSGLQFRPLGSVLFAAPAPPTIQTETFRLRYAKAEEISKVIAASAEEARVAVESTNNLLIVTGPPQAIEIARAIVTRVEVAPLQVAIYGRILETNLTGDEHLGIEWSDSFGISATTPRIPHSWPLSNSSESSYMPGYDPSDVRSRGDKAVPYAATSDFQFGFLTSTGVLQMLQEKTTTRMVANPTVTTVENQEAKINIVTKFPVAQYQVSSETGVLTISGFEYQEFGTILTVTPRVSDGHVILHVHPEVSRQAGVTRFQDAELPIIHSQEADTKVRIKDGDTLVIAGLIREDTENRNKEVPGFSRVPLIGRFFRSKHDTIDARRNLLIFITPRIIGPADFARSAELKKKHTEPVPGFDHEGTGPEAPRPE